MDGVVAKRLDLAYQSGERAMLKVKRLKTADCVVGGFRYVPGQKTVGSLLLGLYNNDGLFHHVGFTVAAPTRKARPHQPAGKTYRPARLHRQCARGT